MFTSLRWAGNLGRAGVAGVGERLRSSVALLLAFACGQAMGQSLPQQPYQVPRQSYPQQYAAPQQLHAMPQHAATLQPHIQQPTAPVPNGPLQLAPSPVSQHREDELDLEGKHTPYIDRLMDAEYKLELEHRHSKLIRTNRRVRRFAITDPSVVDLVEYSPDEMSIVGLGLGKTDLTFWFEDDDEPAIYEVTVIRDRSLEEQLRIDFGRLERKLALLFPDSNVYLIPLNDQVIVRGLAHDSEEAAQILQIVRAEVDRSGARRGGANRGTTGAGGGFGTGLNNLNGIGGGFGFDDGLVNQLRIAGEAQVMLRVRIAELNRTQARQMGVDWNVIFNNARHTVSGTLGGAPAILQGVFENNEINVAVNWLARNGTVNVLAEPVITTLSGHPASFLSGAEFAVPTIIGLGGGQNTTFRGVGTSLIVTPTIRDRDLVRLQIVPEFSQTTGANTVNGIPGTNVRRVQTVVELREGQTIVLGGLISRQTTTGVDRVPLLGSLPIVGRTIFHSKNANEGENELLILVTPEIVRPMDADEVPPVPGYYVTHPNDHDLYYYARTEGNPDQEVYQLPPFGAGQGYGHPVGYQLFNHPPHSSQLAPHATGGFVGAGGIAQPVQGGTPTYNAPAQPMPSMPHSGHSSSPVPATPVPAAPPQQYQSAPQYQTAPPATQPFTPVPSGPAATPPPPIPQPDVRFSQPGSTRPVSSRRFLPKFRINMPFVKKDSRTRAASQIQTGH